MYTTIYEFLRGGTGVALIVAGIAFLVDGRRDSLRIPLCILYVSVGLLFSLSALNPVWLDPLVGDGVVLLLVYLVSQSFYELVVFLLGGSRASARVPPLYLVGAVWTLVLWLVPLAADNAGAVRYYQQAAKLTPDNAALFMNLARAQGALGHVAEADTAMARARQLDPQLVDRGGPVVPVAGSSTRAAEASASGVLWLDQ